MKKLFGVALLTLPLLAVSARAEGWPYSVQAGGSFYVRGGPGPAWPNAGPWYLYWPLEAHFVAPAPTCYPYWRPPMGLPNMSFGGPAVPPQPPHACAPNPAMVAPAPAQPVSMPTPVARTSSVQPTSYYPVGAPVQVPSYWFSR
jgi:hypothetical protein